MDTQYQLGNKRLAAILHIRDFSFHHGSTTFNDMHTDSPLMTILHTTRPTRRLFTTTLQLVELYHFLDTRLWLGRLSIYMHAGSKDQLDHSAFWLSKIWRKCYKVARAGPYTTTILELSIFISFLIVSFHTYMLYALCFILLWI
jgi:hypothetical protein